MTTPRKKPTIGTDTTEAAGLRSRTSPLASGVSGLALILLLLTPALEGQEPVDARVLPRPVEPPLAYQAALASETRSLDGRPGPAYWQQRADYRIQAELDPGTGRVNAREVITYHNQSPDTLPLVVLRLEQNVFAEGARRNRRAPVTGGVSLESLRVNGRDAPTRHVGSSYYESLTLLQVQLPEPLLPGQQADIEVRWSFTVPPARAFRTGNLDGEVFAVAQWYPRMAVYDDVYGWDLTPYLGDGEFYLEYGSFDVQITVPADWLVAATGELENPEEVLSSASLRRLREAPASDSVIRVVTEEQIAEGTATRSGPDELTWRFTASDVRDFSFATSPRYLWEARGVEVPNRGRGPGEGQRALLQAFYRPGLTAWNRGLEYMAHGITTLSEWLGPFVYPQVTITETSVGGMEYPMLIFNPSTNSPTSLAGVTIHEVAHQWFPMAVGTMEAKHAWMDEGIGTYWEELSLA
ncbi:MAG: M1 family metallopeptidase, partial [Longimicrobiales bacterium]|nr:M1 family metallopeptidase [Longimicrobiales bacterium]